MSIRSLRARADQIADLVTALRADIAAFESAILGTEPPTDPPPVPHVTPVPPVDPEPTKPTDPPTVTTPAHPVDPPIAVTPPAPVTPSAPGQPIVPTLDAQGMPVTVTVAGRVVAVKTGCKSTIWRNKSDEGKDPDTMASGFAARPGDGLLFPAVSLPARYRSARWALLQLCDRTGKPAGPWLPMWMMVPEVGPWLDGTRGDGKWLATQEDPYWTREGRPYVETHELDFRGRKDNNASVDVTPRLAAMLITGKLTGADVDAKATQLYHAPTELYVNIAVLDDGPEHPGRRGNFAPIRAALDAKGDPVVNLQQVPGYPQIVSGPPPRFTVADLTKSDVAKAYKVDNTPPPSVIPNLAKFGAFLETVEKHLGRRLVDSEINQVYRSPALYQPMIDAGYKPAKGSDHESGLAGDLDRTQEIYRAIIATAKEYKARAISVYLLIEDAPEHYHVSLIQGTTAVARRNGAALKPWESTADL